MKIQPLRDYVLLEAIEHKAESKSGIVLPDQVDLEPTSLGIVFAAPAYSPLMGDGLQAGDTVLYKPYAFDSIGIQGKKYLYGRQEGIVALVTE